MLYLKAPQLKKLPPKIPNQNNTKNTNQKTQYKSLKNLSKMQTLIKHKQTKPPIFLPLSVVNFISSFEIFF